jgi:hypothetical protein
MGLDLCTLAEVKAYAGITSTNQDTLIKQLIPQVSGYIKDYCKRTFIDYVNDVDVKVFSGGDAYIYLPEAPTIVVSSFELSTDYGKTYTTLTEFTDYILDIQYDRLQVIGQQYFPKYFNGYKVTYTAGFETLPEQVKLATMDTILYYLKSDMSVKSPSSIGRNTTAIEYITNGKLPSHISRVLDFWVLDYP